MPLSLVTFLQGQTTCDTRELGPERSLPGVYCTPQGRVVCDFLLTEFGPDHVVLRMKADIVEHAAAVLGKYIVFSKADIDVQRNDWQPFACWGNKAAAVLGDVLGGHPAERGSAFRSEHAIVVQLDDAGQVFECYINTLAAPALAATLLERADEGSEDSWQALQIRDAMARIESATVEAFVPQSVNYDLTGHISFTKGCYTGQEVVARLHYRGTPKRRAYLAALPSDSSVSVGDNLFAKGSGKNVGDIVNIAVEGDRMLLLVSATIDGIAAGVTAGDASGPALEKLEQPYSVDDT